MTTDNIHRSSNIEFLITNACNLRCKYCFMEKNLGQDKADIESLKKYILNSGNKDVYVFGGEPLVNIDGIIELIEYVESLGIKNKQSILNTLIKLTTNGTLIEKHLDKIKKYGFACQISLDGDREANSERVDLSGRESFDDAMKGIDLCRENDIPYSIHGVISMKNARRYSELIKFLYEVMSKDPKKDPIDYFHGNFAMMVFEEEYTDSFIDEFLEQLEVTTRWILSLDLPEEKKTKLFENVILRRDLHGVCGAGTGLKTIDNQSMLYPCHRSILKPEQRLGNAFNANKLENIDFYNTLHDLRQNGFVYSPTTMLYGLSGPREDIGWAMWCPSTNMETADDPTYFSAKYAVLIHEVNRFTKYLRETYKI